MTSGACPPAVWVASLSQYVLNSPGCGAIFTFGFALVYASIAAWVFLLRMSLPHQANFMSAAPLAPPPPPPPPLLPLLPEPGAQPASPTVVAAVASPAAPIRNCLRFRAIASPSIGSRKRFYR